MLAAVPPCTGAGSVDAPASSADVQAMLDRAAGGVLTLPPGVYRVDQTLRLPSHITLRGAGPERTVLRATSALARLLQATGATDLRLVDLGLEGDGNCALGPESEGAVVCTAPERGDAWPLNLSLERVRIRGFAGSGVVVLGTPERVAVGLTLRDCTIRETGRHAVLAYFCREIRIEGCRLERLGGSGTIFARCAEITVRDTRASDTGLSEWGHGLEVGDESRGFLFEGNTVKNAGDHAGILVEQGASRGAILNNRIANPRFVGIQVNNKPGAAGTSDIRVAGNLIDMGENRAFAAVLVYGDTTFLAENVLLVDNTILGGRTGVEIHHARNASIRSNLICEPAACGLDLVYLRRATIAGNRVRGSGSHGLRVRPFAESFLSRDLIVADNAFERAADGEDDAAGIRLDQTPDIELSGNRCARYTTNILRSVREPEP